MAIEVRWLYSSKGSPIAFLYEGAVFSRAGKFLGFLEGNYVLYDEYVGELFEENRLVRQRLRPLMAKHEAGEDFALEMSPPKPIEAIVLPSELQDLEPY